MNQVIYRRFHFTALVWVLLPALAGSGGGCGRGEHDLVVTGAAVFQPETGRVSAGQTVLVDAGVITEVGPDRDLGNARGRVRIGAQGRLLTPGFIDVHHHLASVFGDSITAGGGEITHLSMVPDSIAAYRRRWAREYLPFGVTAVREAGAAEESLPLLVAWMDRDPAAPDFYPCGGALISEEAGRTPYQGHVALADTAAARAKVERYYELGFRHLKLYWRLREPEFDAALGAAQALGMNSFGHIDYNVVSIAHALDRGLRDFEHAITLFVEVMEPKDFDAMWALPWLSRARERNTGLYFSYVTELGNFVGPQNPRLLALIERLRKEGATVTPTLHIFAQRLGLTYFTTPSAGDFDDMSGLSDAELERARRGYEILAGYVRTMHERGIPLNLGTDSADPGRAALSELLLLHAAGIPMPGVLRIATLNGARAIGREDLYGSIEPGKRANLILFEKSPLDDPKNLLAGKRVIKDGVEWADTKPESASTPER